jgi:hypothetical protein
MLSCTVEHLRLVVARLIRGRVDAIHRAHVDARVVLDPDAWFGDYIGHGAIVLG